MEVEKSKSNRSGMWGGGVVVGLVKETIRVEIKPGAAVA